MQSDRARPELPTNDSFAQREAYFGALLDQAILPTRMKDEIADLRDETPGFPVTNEQTVHCLIEGHAPHVIPGKGLNELTLPEITAVFEASVLAERAQEERKAGRPGKKPR